VFLTKEDQPSTDSQAFERLAQLSPAQYDRSRRAEARRLGIRIATLDTEVAKYRSELDLQAQANAVKLPAIELWPEPVDGASTLDQVSSRFALYLFLPPGAADALALWTTHSHAFAAFHLTPRLNLHSPKEGCGKTTAFDVLTTMAARPLRTENISAPVLFRLVDQHQPTLLLDEVDAYIHQSEELRGLLNAGHKRGACAYRCEGEGNAVRAFNAFAPAALAGIGSLPATLRDRSILIPLVAAEEGQLTTRFDQLHTEIENILARKLARWASDNFTVLAACDPPLPPGAFNRLADNWRPLLAIAQVAGGDWPQRALAAFTHLAGNQVRTLSTLPDRSQAQAGASPSPPRSLQPSTFNQQLTLLADIRQLFAQSGSTRISSKQLVESLCALPDRSYSQPSSLNHQRCLARLLRPFGINSHNIRLGNLQTKGYDLTDFTEAFSRFLEHEAQTPGGG
jgi:putative DNA primase/helicase